MQGMEIIWLSFVVAGISACVGFGVAICIERRSRRAQRQDLDRDESEDRDESDLDSEFVRELVEGLLELTSAVDDNVDRHTSQVARINDQLNSDGGLEPAAVVAAAKKLIESNKQLSSDLATSKTEMQLQQRQLDSYMTQARTDELTKLANRRAFDEELRRRLAQWERQGTPVSLLMIDVDHFKRFNDYHGHQTGDDVLAGVAEVLEETARGMDIVARYGGEEFAAILPGTELREAAIAGERHRAAVAEFVIALEEAELRVTVSIGVAQVVQSEDRNGLVKRADEALYAAKQAGRNCCFYHNDETTLPVPQITNSEMMALT
ncbi:MAG: GGDEF domain-containing protein [Planctomycetaceae bacterium]